jgi:hypothetical protein
VSTSRQHKKIKAHGKDQNRVKELGGELNLMENPPIDEPTAAASILGLRR